MNAVANTDGGRSPSVTTIVGAGRAGGAFAGALRSIGVTVVGPLVRADPVQNLAAAPGLVLLCVSDAAVAEVSAAIAPGPGVVAHVAGSLPVSAIHAHHARRASLHPLMALPDPEVGAQRLLGGGWFAVAGDSVVDELVTALSGRTLQVDDDQRVRYHAAAAVASNHVTALLGQVERIAASIGLPLEPFLDLCQGSLDAVRDLGPRGALTGPAARGDSQTIERHLDALAALDRRERATYEAVMIAAKQLAEQQTIEEET